MKNPQETTRAEKEGILGELQRKPGGINKDDARRKRRNSGGSFKESREESIKESREGFLNEAYKNISWRNP